MKRLVWLVVPLALMLPVVFAARYLIEHTDGPQRETVGIGEAHVPGSRCDTLFFSVVFVEPAIIVV